MRRSHMLTLPEHHTHLSDWNFSHAYRTNIVIGFLYLHHVSKNCQNCFRQNFVKFPLTLIIFGT